MEVWKKNLYILWVTQIISLTSFGFGLPFMPFYIQKLGVTDPDALKLYTGILSAAPAITMAIMAPVWGYLSDRYGRKLMIQRAMFGGFVIISLMGLVNHVWQLVLLRLLQGMFTGTVTASSTFVASNTPDNQLSYALGFLSSSTFIGYSVGPTIGGLVAEAYGYRASFIVGGLLMLIGFIILTRYLVEDKSSMVKSKVKTELAPRGAKIKTSPLSILTGPIVILLIMLVFHRITRSVFSPFLPLFIQENVSGDGVVSLTGVISGVVGFITAFSAIIIGRMGDRFSKINVMWILLGLGCLDAVFINLNQSWIGFLIGYCLLFFLIGGVEPMITSMSAQRVSADRRGTLFGIQGLMGSIGWLFSPTIGTYVSIQFGTKSVLWVILVALVVNFILVSLIKYKVVKRAME